MRWNETRQKENQYNDKMKEENQQKQDKAWWHEIRQNETMRLRRKNKIREKETEEKRQDQVQHDETK